MRQAKPGLFEIPLSAAVEDIRRLARQRVSKIRSEYDMCEGRATYAKTALQKFTQRFRRT